MDLYIDKRSEISFDEALVPKLEKCVRECLVVQKFPQNCEISLSLVDNDEIHQLNNTYRNKDCPTDVLSFPMIESEKDLKHEIILLGDIIISIPKTQEQAIEYGHTFERELCYLTIHGMFHLLGYDHMNEEDKVAMRIKEKEVVKNLNL
ncbi:rRNA maturation RNase YbeY [Alkalibaculum sp. M08DMB]|uniref:Endoribonuclease YbeY n=1 Tax=Alkalibaculum sporogenes TaxID=2655001 RepID=A0A6A7KBZ5_9FIRM|nr:rRNA maturation RNase YbeY [Alkalibaculum sporogenes]MPW27038.1 rRNA maturation RNase YbeY [Alkalibaculum sporogenes]